MGGACSMDGRYEKDIQHLESTNGRDHSEDGGENGKIILELILEETGWECL